jgi:AcrR family transcriptional regulator
VSVDESATEQPAGRRSRKVQRTRSVLTHSALDLFAERGFDNVTVTDIANRADVDPSTFFRHFRSKESVLFTDMDVYVARILPSCKPKPRCAVSRWSRIWPCSLVNDWASTIRTTRGLTFRRQSGWQRSSGIANKVFPSTAAQSTRPNRWMNSWP